MRKAVVSLGDAQFKPITDLTFPLAASFAKRHGADFIAIQDREYPHVNICYEKFRIGKLLEKYDRVLYVDGDVLINPKAPDIYSEVPIDSFAAMDEAQHINFWHEDAIRRQFEPYGWKAPWNGIHFNAGVMVLSRCHQQLFKNLVITDMPYWDQPYFNISVFERGIPYFSLGREWNCLVYHGYKIEDGIRDRAWFRHFSGGVAFDDKVADIAKAIAAFES